MSDDLVERLRDRECKFCDEAIAEIARLRERLADEFARGFCTAEEAYSAELARLRLVNAELVKALEILVKDYGDVPDPSDSDGQSVFDRAHAALRSATEKGEPI